MCTICNEQRMGSVSGCNVIGQEERKKKNNRIFILFFSMAEVREPPAEL